MGVLASVGAAVAIGFSQQGDRLVVHAPAYRVVLSAANGRILEIDDVRGRKLLGAGYGCMWWLNPYHHATSLGGCGFRVEHAWRGHTLTLTYGRTATVTLDAAASSVDLRLRRARGGARRDQSG